MKLYETIFGRALNVLEPELAHCAALLALKNRLIPAPAHKLNPVLETELWGLKFPNPVGLAAGFDKNGEVPDVMLRLGFGFVEVGTVTPKPQIGNPRPRMFRLTEDRGIINRMGFNNRGIDYVLAQLQAARSRRQSGVIGINVGMNRDAEAAAADYRTGIEAFRDIADYLVINVSSPNTPGLRDLQSREHLTELVQVANAAREVDQKSSRCPLLIKVAPDLEPSQVPDIAEIAIANKIDGIIATNTTVSRPSSLISKQSLQTGGLSGRPLMELSTKILGEFYRATSGTIPVIGVGGIFSGEDAYSKIRAGASLVQIYSGMIFKGPWIAAEICSDLSALLVRDGFSHVSDAVGADHH